MRCQQGHQKRDRSGDPIPGRASRRVQSQEETVPSQKKNTRRLSEIIRWEHSWSGRKEGGRAHRKVTEHLSRILALAREEGGSLECGRILVHPGYQKK